MSITVLGNHGKGYLGRGADGNGVQNIPQGMGWAAITASEAGEEYVVQLSAVLASHINQGIFFQSETGASVQFTLANPGMAMDKDPLVQAAVPWGNITPIPVNTITKAPVIFSACKITFTAPGTVYIGVR